MITAKSKGEYVNLLKKKLSSDNQWAVKGLLTVYERQTKEEQNSMQTIDYNGRGFNGRDAEILTSFAEQYKRKRCLSEKQYAYLKKCMPKYARQLFLSCLDKGTVVKRDGIYQNR